MKVVLVDDHQMIRWGLRELISWSDDIEVAAEAGSGAEALEVVAEVAPDVAVVDMRLPDMSGVELCGSITRSHPDVACLLFTGSDDPTLIADAVVHGASGCVFKDSPGEELLRAIRTVAEGGEVFPPALAGRVLDILREREREQPTVGTTPQEDRILDLLAEGLSNAEIGERLGLAEKTVRNRVSRLLRKLGLESRTQAALWQERRRRPQPPSATSA